MAMGTFNNIYQGRNQKVFLDYTPDGPNTHHDPIHKGGKKLPLSSSIVTPLSPQDSP